MEIYVNYIAEKDIDLLFIEEMVANSNFRSKILKRLNKSDLKIQEVYHSLTHPMLGESDITFVFEEQEKKYGLLVEDKIDAIAMPMQFERYVKRGNQHIHEGLFDDFDVMIIAPQSYLETNPEAQKYPYSVSYEEMLSYFNKEDERDMYKMTLLENAIDKKRKGYSPIEDEMVTQFWAKYYEFKTMNYDQLNLNEVKGPRGRDAVWPWFKTDSKNVKIAHKSDRGIVDLTLIGTSKLFSEIYEKLINIIDDEMEILKVAKSTVIRIKIPTVDFTQPFEVYTEEMFYIFEKIKKLNDFTKKSEFKNIVAMSI